MRTVLTIIVALGLLLTASCGYHPTRRDGEVTSDAGSHAALDTPLPSGDLGNVDSLGTGGKGGTGNPDGNSNSNSQPPLLLGDPITIPFGSVPMGQKSAVQTVRINNQGHPETGLLTLNIDDPQFALESGASESCSSKRTLAGGVPCIVSISFTPKAIGPSKGTLTVSATPGGSVTIALTGTGVIPGSLKLSAKSIEFGSTPVGTSVTKSISVSNSGQTSINNVRFVVADDHAVQFSRVTGGKDDCVSTIAPGVSCELSVNFLASKRGTFAGTITLLPDGQDALSATLGGVALGPAIVQGDLTEIAFPGQEVGIASTISKTWTITNIGDRAAATAPIVASTNPDEFPFTHTCKDSLPPNSTCTVSIQFRPKEGAVRQGAINVTTDGSTLKLPLSGSGLFRLTINKIVGGADCATCAVKSGEEARLIDCGGICSALFERGAQVKLQATTTNGSGHWFSGWSGDATTSCVGPLRSCEVTIGSSLTLGATFSAMTNNLIFYSSTEHAADAGSATKYDQICNTLASNAGINNASKNGYVAWVSDANSLATQRVFHSPTIQGWVRMDGRVFAVNRNELLSKDAVVNPVAFDENGLMGKKEIFTGTQEDGTLNPELNCKNWTSNSPNDPILGGTAQSGPRSWSAGWYGPSCANGFSVLCLGNTSSSPVALTMAAGKKIWTTAKPFFPGSGITPDDWCLRNTPAGVSEVKALVARTNSAAALVLSASTVYVRLDGQRVGTGAALIKVGTYGVADSYLETGIWQDNLGAYTTTGLGLVWTGAPTIDAVGTVESTCGNWSDATKTGGMVGQNTYANNSFFRFTTQSCTPADFYEGALYCVEQ